MTNSRGQMGVFTAALAGLPERLADYMPAPRASDRTAWGNLPAAVRERLVERGEAALAAAWPPLLASHYLDYTLTGNRTRFEAIYFDRRRQLNALVMAECAEGQGRFLAAITDGIFLLVEESGWQLPAHNSRERGGPRLPLPDTERPVIDLFAAETGAQLAVIAALFGDRLDAAVIARIDRELTHRIVRPYLDRHFWWMGNGDEPMNNWTAWCTQNVLITVFTRPTDQATRQAVVRQAAYSLDAFVKDYGEDGACEEGPHYYRHAALCLWGATEILASIAPTFGAIWRQEKIRNMGEYIANVHVAGRHYFNFADCAAVIEHCGAREYLFGRAVGSPLLMNFAKSDAAEDDAFDLPDEINLWYRLIQARNAADMREGRAVPPAIPDHYYPSVGLMIARGAHWALAAKAGDNGDSHNHNDVGSFTLYRDGQPVLIDVGVESYTATTFSPRRYEIWTMQSAWHNLPSFGGIMQRDGADFAARDVAVTLGATESSMEMELAGAWPEAARLRFCRRTVRLVKGEGVAVEDDYDGDMDAELTLMFAARPDISGRRISLPGLAEIALEGAGAMRMEERPITDERLRKAWPHSLWRVLVPVVGNRLKLHIT